MKVPIVALALILAPSARDAAADTIELRNGDKLSGLVLERSEERIVLEHPVLGRLEVPTSELAPPPPPDDGAFGSGLLRDWDRTLELGFSGASGNSDNQRVSAGLELDYADEQKRWKIGAGYLLSASDGSTDDHQAFASVERDWRFPGSRWFAFGNGRFDWDQFEDWDFRLSSFGGGGYEFYDTETFELRGRAGLGLTREFGTGEGITPEALLGMEMKWALDDRQTLRAYNRLIPALDDPGEFRNVSGLDYTVSVNGDLGLRLGLDNEYDTSVDSGTKRNDFTYRGSLVYDF